VTLPGIDPGTVRLIAQRLNHYATPDSLFLEDFLNIFLSPLLPTCKNLKSQYILVFDQLTSLELPCILESNPHPNQIHTSFCRFLKRKKKVVRGSNPHISFNRPLGAALSEVARWVSAAWKAIPESIIVRSFKCCINNALDGSEDDILWEDDGEDKDDSDWVTHNDSIMSDDGESDEQ
jgi:hypothetical protein